MIVFATITTFLAAGRAAPANLTGAVEVINIFFFIAEIMIVAFSRQRLFYAITSGGPCFCSSFLFFAELTMLDICININ
jgi:hypothetical protein